MDALLNYMAAHAFCLLYNPDVGTVLVSCDTGTVLMSHTHVTGHKNRPHVRVNYSVPRLS